jgi:hypothetical protein
LFQAGVYLHWAPERTANLMALSGHARGALASMLSQRVQGLVGAGENIGSAAEVIRHQVTRALLGRAGLRCEAAAWTAGELAARAEALPRYAALT